LLSQAWREKSLVLLMADAVPQTERRTPRRVGNMVADTVAVEPVSASNHIPVGVGGTIRVQIPWGKNNREF